MSTPDNDAPHEEFEGGPQSDYEVGYGKPPKQHTFQKGNKKGKGRKKGSKGMKRIVNEAFGMKVKGSLAGKVQSISKFEAGMHQLATKHSQGDAKATDKAIALYERYGPQDQTEGPPKAKLKKDYRVLRRYLEMQELICPDDEEGDDG